MAVSGHCTPQHCTIFVPGAISTLNMPPKRSARNSSNAQNSGQEPDLAHSPPEGSQHGDPVPAKKRPTVADNARAIHTMELQMGSMAVLLNRIAENVCPPTERSEPPVSAPTFPEADPENYTCQARPVE